MDYQQLAVLAILVATIAMFVWGRWRHDMVAIAALLACVVVGLVPAETAFEGFGHPAVITVAGVLVLSRALQTTGAIDAIALRLLPYDGNAWVAVAAVTVFAAVLSAFMNNVGALALLMPFGLQIAERHDLPPARVLMPLAFGSILGGMTTLIGTPPNLIVASFRAEVHGSGFTMFDFAPVGVPVAIGGIAAVLLLARVLVPSREPPWSGTFQTEAYTTEARVPPDTRADGMTIGEIEKELLDADAFVVGLVRNEVRVAGMNPRHKVRDGDILIIEADPTVLGPALAALGLVLEADQPQDPDEAGEAAGEKLQETPTKSESKADTKSGEAEAKPKNGASETASRDADYGVMELVVLPDSPLLGRSAADIHLRSRLGINLLALSRRGTRSRARLRTMPIRAGDVLLLQGPRERIAGFAGQFGCLPLAQRRVTLPNREEAVLAVVIMAAAVLAAAFGLAPAAVTFTGGVLAVMATGLVPPRTVYEAIDWPVIVLLGALIPVAGAMETTGTADLIAHLLLDQLAQGNRIVALVILLVVTMTLSDFLNNAATAAVMCPIAIGTAASVGASADPFLMAVAVGASCAFLTPIGHQNSTLILGPAGLRFGDYWRLGLPLEVVVVAIGVPLILLVWPF